ncbi:MAG: hypothetical protein P1P84_16810 [Deferrisomatales bacterium]|nr:hypothetical protein [Deferrisomatales bacterium]
MILSRWIPFLFCSWVLGSACTTLLRPFTPNRDAFFDPRIIEELELGRSTPDDVRGLLGEPYLESRVSSDLVMWVYDFNPTRQAVAYFRANLLVEKGWTIRYPNPLDPEMIFRARPELRSLQGE